MSDVESFRRFACRLMATLLGIWTVMFIMAALFAKDANAQTLCPKQPTCDPVTQRDRNQCGAELKGTTPLGQWRAWWFPVNKTPTRWEWCPFKWAMLDKYQPSPKTVIQIADALKDSPDVPLTIMVLMQQGINPPAGSMDEFEFKMLHYAACQALHTNPPAVLTDALPPCVAPTNPTPPATWKAVGGTIWKHAAGKVVSVVLGKTAAKDAACTGTTVATVGTFTYQPLVGGPLDEATRCVKL